ncbi:MAG TPA: hypothetical protein VHM20_05775 [Gammaproteobacteria bacterium]|jgi:hypothetical protein|nr:hypothetical protein [Gammaproteobacteria bacterium]
MNKKGHIEVYEKNKLIKRFPQQDVGYQQMFALSDHRIGLLFVEPDLAELQQANQTIDLLILLKKEMRSMDVLFDYLINHEADSVSSNPYLKKPRMHILNLQDGKLSLGIATEAGYAFLGLSENTFAIAPGYDCYGKVSCPIIVYQDDGTEIRRFDQRLRGPLSHMTLLANGDICGVERSFDDTRINIFSSTGTLKSQNNFRHQHLTACIFELKPNHLVDCDRYHNTLLIYNLHDISLKPVEVQLNEKIHAIVPSATQSEIVISTKSGIKVYNLQGNLIQEMDQQIPSESRLKDFLAEESMSKNFSIK